MTVRSHGLHALLVALLAVSLLGCPSPAPFLVPSTFDAKTETVVADGLIVLEPCIVRDVADEWMSFDSETESQIAERIVERLHQALARRDWPGERVESLEPALGEAVSRARLELRSERSLFDAERRAEALERELAPIPLTTPTLLAVFKAKRRDENEWRSDLVVALYEPRSKRVVWVSQVFFRSMPWGRAFLEVGMANMGKTMERSLDAAIDLVLADFPARADAGS